MMEDSNYSLELLREQQKTARNDKICSTILWSVFWICLFGVGFIEAFKN